MSDDDSSTISSDKASTIGLLPGGDKALFDYNVDKRNFCEENWYDWFTIPNYHLGNNYTMSKKDPKVCYKACPTYSVPAYGTDPVDGELQSIFDTDDKIDKCVARDTYFAGKYANGIEYCPLTKIHLLNNAVRTDLISYTTSNYPLENVAFVAPETDTVDQQARLDVLKTNIDNKTIKPTFEQVQEVYNSHAYKSALNTQVNMVVKNLKNQPEFANVQAPGYKEMIDACNGLNTTQRVSEAYKVCSELYSMDSDTNAELAMLGNSSNVVMMKQACKATFCSGTNNAIDLVDPVYAVEGEVPRTCFKDVTIEEIEDDYSPPIPEEEQYQMFTAPFSAFMTAAYVVFIFLVCLFLYICITNGRGIWEFFLRRWIKWRLGVNWGEVYDKRDEFMRLVKTEIENLEDAGT